MKTIDNTNGMRPTQDEQFELTVRFKNGNSYCYYGDTKKEATENFKAKWLGFSKVEVKEWEIV